jgi:nucleoside 2-deoxyribosyltransferase
MGLSPAMVLGQKLWREFATQVLRNEGIDVRSPVRHVKTAAPEDLAAVLRSPRSILHRDRFDCTNASALLVGFPEETQGERSLGTAMEIAWADQLGIPVIAWFETAGVQREETHPMITECFSIVTTGPGGLLTAIQAVCSYLKEAPDLVLGLNPNWSNYKYMALRAQQEGDRG